MEDSPEIAKLLKYILFGYYILSYTCTAYLVTEGPSEGDSFPSFRSSSDASSSFNGEPFHHDRKQNDLDPNDKERRGPPPPPPQHRYGEPFDKFGGSLCSIFRTFLEPRRRFHRCRVSKGGRRGPPPNHQYRRGPPPPPPGPQQDSKEMMSDSSASKRFDHNHPHNNHPHLEDTQINNSGEEDNDHSLIEDNNDEQGRGDFDPTKISMDRTMILVPERSCPHGHRRDSRGYCRRVVKIRTNYQYGPPPLYQKHNNNNMNSMNNNNVVRSIPIRYYYSRIVTIPAFQFFFPN